MSKINLEYVNDNITKYMDSMKPQQQISKKMIFQSKQTKQSHDKKKSNSAILKF